MVLWYFWQLSDPEPPLSAPGSLAVFWNASELRYSLGSASTFFGAPSESNGFRTDFSKGCIFQSDTRSESSWPEIQAMNQYMNLDDRNFIALNYLLWTSIYEVSITNHTPVTPHNFEVVVWAKDFDKREDEQILRCDGFRWTRDKVD